VQCVFFNQEIHEWRKMLDDDDEHSCDFCAQSALLLVLGAKEIP